MREKIKKEKEEMKKVSESIAKRKASKRAELEAIRLYIAVLFGINVMQQPKFFQHGFKFTIF